MSTPKISIATKNIFEIAFFAFFILFTLQIASAASPFFSSNHTYQNIVLEDDNIFAYVSGSNVSFQINVTDTDGNLANATFQFNNTNYTVYVSNQNLTSWLTFNDFSGTNAIDRTGSGHNGTLGVGAAWHTGANCTFGSCVMMDGNGGSGNSVNVENTQNGRINDSFTVVAWLKLGTNNAAQDRIIDNAGSGPVDGFALRYSNDMNLLFDVKKGGTSTAQIEPVGYNQTDVWKFWALVFSNQSQTSNLYVDGVLVGTDASTQMSPSTEILKFGRRTSVSTNQANVTVDEVRLYLRPLNQSEILALYQIAKGGGNLSQVYQIPDTNISSTFFINISPPAGTHTFKWYAADFTNNVNATSILSLIADGTGPIITILNPTNATFTTSSVWANATLDEAGSWCGRSLNGASNVTLTNNTGNWNNLVSSLTRAPYNIIFYCNDTFGNMGSSSLIYFTVSVNTLLLSGKSIYSLTGLPVSSGTSVVVVLETNDYSSAAISNGNWEVSFSPSLADGVRFNFGIFVNDSTGKSGYNKVTTRQSGSLPETTTCKNKIWRFSGNVVNPDTASLPSSGNVRVEILRTQYSNSTSYSNGIWEVYVTPCLIPGKTFDANIFLTDSAGRTGVMLVRQIAV